MRKEREGNNMEKENEVQSAEIVALEDNDVNSNVLVPKMVMSVDRMKTMHEEKRMFITSVLVENHDYGKIPGAGNKPSLWKPGAEKLLQVYGFGSLMTKTEESSIDEPSRYEVTYKCQVIHKSTGNIVSECEGSVCSEEKRHWTKSPRIQKNAMRKMAQKRAFVGAALLATGCSDSFTQDLEDMREHLDIKQTQPKASVTTPKPIAATSESQDIIEVRSTIKQMYILYDIPVDTMKEIMLTVTGDPKLKIDNIKDLEHLKEIKKIVHNTGETMNGGKNA